MKKFKSTESIEKERLQLWEDYQTYLKVEKSEKLKEYLTLKEKVESTPFLEKKKEIESLRFKGSPEENELKEFQKLKRNKKLSSYFNLKGSNDLKRYHSIDESGQIEQLGELEAFAKSGKYKADLKAYKRKLKKEKQAEAWEKSESFSKMKAYKELKSSSDVLFYKRFKKSKALKNFLTVDDSALLHQFEDLKAEIESPKFNERKAYLEDLKRYEKTDDFKTLGRFKELDVNQEIQLYLKYNDTDAFKFYRGYISTFNDDFKSLNKKTWSYVTPIAKKGPERNFSFRNQLHYANNSDNFDVENGILTLETKKEKVEGLYWSDEFGFIPKQFNYVSGLVHTVGNFEQEYGYFEVKFKVSKAKGVVSSISLVDESEETCIRLASSNGSEIYGGLVLSNQLSKSSEKVKLAYPAKGYMIIGLKWTPEKIEWKVNDVSMGSLSQSIPHIPLGLRIETEVLKETSNLPHRIDVDWIKVYKKSN